MIFSGPKAGHPWHGEWRSSTGKITPPATADIDCPGEPPKVRLQSLPRYVDTAHSGDCYKVEVPDMPAVETTTEEALLGETWFNYALISGARHRLYGIELGKEDWIYVAPDNSRWRVNFSFATLDLATSTSTNMSVALTRFGEFAETITGEDAQSLGTVSVDLALDRPNPGQSLYPLSGSAAARAYVGIEDIRTDGARALLAVQADMEIESTCPLQDRVLYSVIELRIEGTPPDAAMSFVTVAATSALTSNQINSRWQKFRAMTWYKDEFDVDQVWLGAETNLRNDALIYLAPDNLHWLVYLISDEEWYEPDPPPGGNAVFGATSAYIDCVSTAAIAFRYGATDQVVEKVVVSVSWVGSYSGSITPIASATVDWSATGTLTGTGTIDLNAVNASTGTLRAALKSHAASLAASWAGEFDGPSVWSGSYSLNGETTTFSYENTGGITAGYISGISASIGVLPDWWSTHSMARVRVQGTESNFEWLLSCRYSNAVVGIARKTTLPAASRPVLFWSVHGKVGAETSLVSADGTTSYPVFVSEQPVTGEILRSTTPVAWV
jgi:hypothetical protein